MAGNKVSAGIWFMGENRDRFARYKERPVSMEERFRIAGKTKGLEGIELHYPNEISDDTIEDTKRWAKENGLQIVSIVPNLFNEPQWQNGAITATNKKIRKAALDRMKRTAQINKELGCKFMIVWPGQEGNDGYILTSNYIDDWKRMRDGFVEVLESVPGVNIAFEHKPNDPKIYITAGNTGKALLMCHEVNEQIGAKRMGMNIEIGHVQIARENLAESFCLALKDGLLFHIHVNDNNREKEGDTDLMPGTANFMETLELFFWLKELNYKGWYGLDLNPQRIDAKAAMEQSIQNLRYFEALAAALPRKTILKYIQEPNAVETTRAVFETLKKGVRM